MELQPGDHQYPNHYPMAVPFNDGSVVHFKGWWDNARAVVQCKHEEYVLGMFNHGSSYVCRGCLTVSIWPVNEWR